MALRRDGYGVMLISEISDDDQAMLQAFRCGKPHLDQFLVSSSRDLDADRLGLTHIAFHQDVPGTVIGYYTLSNDGLPLKTSEQDELGVKSAINLSVFPAVKLGRLAVAQHWQGQGVGRQLMQLVLGQVLDRTACSAARLLVVDADNDPPVLAFYKGLGFQDSLWAENQARNHGRGGRAGTSPTTIKMVRDVLLAL